MEKYQFLTEEDLEFVSHEQKTNKKFEEIALEKTLKEIGSKIITLEGDKTLTLQEALALRFFRYVYENPTPKNIETYAKLTGQFKENLDVSLDNTAAMLMSCKADTDETK